MIPDTNGKPESRGSEAEQLTRLLEMELAQKKMEWAAATERYRKIRAASFLFLALIIMGAMAIFFIYVLPKLETQRPVQSAPVSGGSP